MSKIAKVVLSIIMCVVVLILFIPTILSTSAGKNFILGIAEKQMQAKITLDSLNISWAGPQEFTGLALASKTLDLNAENITADISLLSLMRHTQIPLNVNIKELNANIHDPKLPKAEFASINVTSNQKNNITNVTISGKSIEENRSGHFHIISTITGEGSKSTLDSKIDISDFPSIGLDRLIAFFHPKLSGLFSKVFGSSFNLSAKLQFSKADNSGPLDFTIKSPNVEASGATYFKNGTLFLSNAFNLSFSLTRELSDFLLKDNSHPPITHAESIDPIKLNINANGFELPLTNFNLKNVKVANAQLNLGKLRAKSGDALASLISLLKFQSLFGSKELTLWFTAVNLQLNDGILTADRMDALVADSLHVCTWGSIDLIKDRLNMTLGIAGTSLMGSLGIQGLDDDYMMTTPVRGSLSNPQIGKDIAAKKIGALLGTGVVGGFLGKVGKVVGIAGAEDQSKIPPPKKPFPWGDTSTPVQKIGNQVKKVPVIKSLFKNLP